MVYGVSNLDVVWNQARRDLKAEKAESSERYMTGQRTNTEQRDIVLNSQAFNIKKEILGNESVKLNVQYGKQVVSSTLSDIKFIKKELQEIFRLVASSRGASADSRAIYQKDLQARSARINQIAVSSKYNEFEMLKGAGKDLSIALESNYHSNPNSVPKLTMDSYDLRSATLNLNKMNLVKSGIQSVSVAQNDLNNIKTINDALAKATKAEAEVSSALRSFKSEENFLSSKVDMLKNHYDDLSKIDRAEELMRLRQLQQEEQMVKSAYGLTMSDTSKQELANLMQRMRP